MILAQNLLQQLNGSKWVTAILAGFLLSSCGIFSERTGHRSDDVAVEKEIKAIPAEDPIKISVDSSLEEDTMVYEVLPVKKDQKIDHPAEVVTIPNTLETEYKDVYQIALLLPLTFDDYLPDLAHMQSHYSYRFLNFYGGFLLGLEKLSKNGISLDVHVFNTQISENNFIQVKSELDKLDPDVIIGPFDRELLKEIEQYGKRNDILVISPWQSSTKIAKENPNYLQLKPDVKRFYEAIIQHADAHFSPSQIFLVGRLSEKQELSRLEYLQDLHKANPYAAFPDKPYQTVYVNQASFVDGAYAFGQAFQNQNEEIAFILPNWSFKDEQFLYSCLRKLNAEKGLSRVSVYGMPLIINSELLDYNLFKNLNIHVAVEKHVDDDHPGVVEFRKDYLEAYNGIATNDAIEGYDMVHFIGENLNRYGTKFQYFIQGDKMSYLQTSYKLVPVLDEDSVYREKIDKPDYFENIHIEIRRFIHIRFELAP